MHLERRRLQRIGATAAIATLLTVATGCVTTNVAPLNLSGPARRPTCADAVAIYTTRDRVPGEYVEVAMLNSSGASGWTSEPAMLKSMREKAASVGATGIILDNIAEPSAGSKVAGAVFGISPERKGRSVAVVVHADTVAVREKCTAVLGPQFESMDPRSFTDSAGVTWTISIQPAGRNQKEGFRFDGPNGAVKFTPWIGVAKTGISPNDDDLRSLLAGASWVKKPK